MQEHSRLAQEYRGTCAIFLLQLVRRKDGDGAGNVVVVIGDEKVDVGLAVKSGRGPLCVPDYTRPAPSGTGWQYSLALATILGQYKVRRRQQPLLPLAPDYGCGEALLFHLIVMGDAKILKMNYILESA